MKEEKASIRDRIVPSAPFKNYAEIDTLAEKVKGNLKRIQVDICDGNFVKSTSWPFTEFSLSDFAQIGANDMVDLYMPFWESINYSADMMCKNPEKYIDTLVTYGIDEIIIHFRSIEGDTKVFESIIEKAKRFELSLCLAVDVKTDLKTFINFAEKYSGSINAFQVMGIEKIGFQGQEFAQESLEIVKSLRKSFKDKTIMFDGGLNADTIEDCLDAGVDVFCIGSYLTKAENFAENLQVVKNLLRE